MTADNDQTNDEPPAFDFSSFPENTVFHERRTGRDRRLRGDLGQSVPGAPARREPGERREKKDRRRRIDPTTFEKQYTDDELEFMNAMQRFKELSGKTFPTYGDVLKVAVMLGYRRAVFDFDMPLIDDDPFEPTIIMAARGYN